MIIEVVLRDVEEKISEENERYNIGGRRRKRRRRLRGGKGS